MYKIKQIPEDFAVDEITSVALCKSGRYAYYILKKTGLTTLQAIGKVAAEFHINQKYINFAGSKDKKAVTTQFISISKGPEKNVDKKHLKLRFIGRSDERLGLGMLEGNHFEIMVRNIRKKPEPITKCVNYFGEQRFGMHNNNHFIGKLLVQKKFKKAVEELAKTEKILQSDSNDYISLLRRLPRKILTMYIHAYQSHLWNQLAESLSDNKENLGLPLIGFGTELTAHVEKVMKQEGIKTRDFIFREFPELSSEGETRQLFMDVNFLSISNLEEDEFNKGMKKCKVGFTLSKGCYATVVIKELFQ